MHFNIILPFITKPVIGYIPSGFIIYCVCVICPVQFNLLRMVTARMRIAYHSSPQSKA
jgi:hypothetical protein